MGKITGRNENGEEGFFLASLATRRFDAPFPVHYYYSCLVNIAHFSIDSPDLRWSVK
jgi:hypothetical protein